MLLFGHELKIFFTVVQTISIFVMNYHAIRTVHDLSVHPDHKLFSVDDFYSVGITVKACSSDIPGITNDSVGIFVIDYDCSGSASNQRAIKKFFRFSVNFNEHYNQGS